MKISRLAKLTSVLALFVGLAFSTTASFGGSSLTIKLGTLAPKGSFYHRALQEMGEEWRQAEGKNARFIVYTDGTQGGEADTVRRMRIGQLNAGLLSIVGLSEIDKSVTALQIMPMMFRSWDEVDHVREKLRPTLEEQLKKKGFVALFWAEGGWVRFFSKKPAAIPDDFKDRKIFAWAGNNEQVKLMKAMGFKPVVLETNDILPSLQSGLINVVPTPAVYALSGQIDKSAPYMLDIKWVPIVGAAVVTRKAWDAMSPEARQVMADAAERVGREIRSRRQPLEQDAIEAMMARGLNKQSLKPHELDRWRELAVRAYPHIRGAMVPTDMFDRVQRLLADYRRERK